MDCNMPIMNGLESSRQIRALEAASGRWVVEWRGEERGGRWVVEWRGVEVGGGVERSGVE
jgi:CheY-like chemotaxis protein